MSDRMQQAWARVRDGQHTLVVGASTLTPPEGTTMCLVRVNCRRWERPLGPVLDVRTRLERLVEESRAPMFVGRMGGDALLRRELMEDDDERGQGQLVELANLLQRQAGMPVVISFEALDEADPATLAVIARMVRAEAGLRVALLLTSHAGHDDLPDDVKVVVSALRERHGAEAIVELESGGSTPDTAQPFDAGVLDDVPFEVMRVMRAGATVGNTFEVDVVAELLGTDVITTLELLQLAMDGGAPVRDLGEGVFRLPVALADHLRDGITPSLATAWHRHLAFLLGGDKEAEADEATVDADPGKRPGSAIPEPTATHNPDRESRAAEHAEAGGEPEVAAGRYREAAMRAASVGAYGRALELLERGLTTLQHRPPTRAQRLARLEALLEMARIKWYAAGDDRESYTFDDALAMVRMAEQLAQPDDPVHLRAEIAAVAARVCYDIGGEEQLEVALERLEVARHLLVDAGRPSDAARLLNDEAAVRMRLGQHLRASELLKRSRELFSRYADSSATARREIADADLLAARLMLHIPEAHREDGDAMKWAMQAAQNAERAFQDLNDSRERARCWETLARLELLQDRPDAAMGYLRSALDMQRELGDVVGLARTSAALADVLSAKDKPQDALALLRDSVALNRMKGSVQGLAYNQKGLDDLIASLDADQRRALGQEIEELRGAL